MDTDYNKIDVKRTDFCIQHIVMTLQYTCMLSYCLF